MADDAVDVFVYTGVGEGAIVPKDVIRVRVNTTVLAIPIEAFHYCAALTEVELHHDLREIGVRSFFFCKALTQVHVSDGVRALEEARSPVVNLLISEVRH